MVKFLVTYVVPASTLFPIIAFLLKKEQMTGALKAIFAYLVVGLVLNVTGIIMASYGLRNLWLFNVYTILEAIILFYFFTQIIHARRAKAVVWFLLIAFPLASIVNLLLLQHVTIFNTYSRSVEAVLIIGMSAYYWMKSSGETLDVAWTNNPLNWIISGLLLYFASGLFLFLFSNFVLVARQTNPKDIIWDIVWGIHGFLIIIMYSLFAIGFIKVKNDR